MSVIQMRGRGGPRHPKVQRTERVFAIAFDLNTESAKRLFGEGCTSHYGKIERVLNEHGFTRQQGSLFFGNAGTQASDCFKAVLQLDNDFPWFQEVVRDMRMLRIDENDDLLSVLPQRLRFDRDVA
jgi:virulence-associated protein VapD